MKKQNKFAPEVRVIHSGPTSPPANVYTWHRNRLNWCLKLGRRIELASLGLGGLTMKIPAEVKPAISGAVGGAIAAIIIGFVWGGWVTGGTAGKMVTTGAATAIVHAFTPLCVARAEKQPEQLVLLKKEDSWKRADFVVKAGWVANVSEKYRSAVAEACASATVEAMEEAAPQPK